MPPKRKTQSQAVTSTQLSTYSRMSSDDEASEASELVESDEQFKQMVSASVQYIIIHSSRGQTLKRLDWINTVLRPLTNDARKYFPSVQKSVIKALQDVFGYKLIFNEKQDGFILVNDLKDGPLENRPLTNPSQYSKYALLMIIVACLKRAGGEMSSTDFWSILGETFSIRQDESTRSTLNHHKYFGDVQKLIKTDFVKEGYLVFEQNKDLAGDVPSQTVKLGFRSQYEFPDHALEKFIDKVNQYDADSDHENDDDAMEDD